MLTWVFILLVILIVAAVFGFGRVTVALAGTDRILFFLFVILFVGSLIYHLLA
jgi:uncharacterized membrane protein YtjA (UPF0391 family)